MKKLIVLLLLTQVAAAQIRVRARKPVLLNPATTMTVEVTFATPPASVSVGYTNLKYDKQSAINIEWDDNYLGAFSIAKPLLDLYSFTDGAGNNIPYRWAIAVNGRNNFNNGQWGANYFSKASYAQMKALIAAGGDVENHGYYHEPTGNFSNGTDWQKNIREATKLLWDSLGYRMSVFVVPTNWTGHVGAADTLGYLASTSTNINSSYPAYPGASGPRNVDINTLPLGFVQLGRRWVTSDAWSFAVIEGTIKPDITAALTTSSATVNKLYRVFSHAVDSTQFRSVLRHIDSLGADKVWVTTARELLEYRIVKSAVVKSQRLAGNKLRITFNLSAISDRIRWRDLTLKITSNAAIQSVRSWGAHGLSYNTTTNLVNLKRQALAFADPGN